MAGLRSVKHAFWSQLAVAGHAALILSASYDTAFAYLDPGTGSIILQAVIGAIAAGPVIGRGYLYRIKAWLGLTSDPASKNGQQPSE